MKKFSLLIAAVVLMTLVVGYDSEGALDDQLGAQILSTERSIVASVTSTAPKSPDFLNAFNPYSEAKSELALQQKYAKHIQGASTEMLQQYQEEILSFVDRVSKNPNLKSYLPMWPDHNVATYGNTMAYLFAEESNPLVYAKSKGVVGAGVQANAYLSRFEFLSIVGRVFVDPDKDPATVLRELGFIDSEERWKDQRKSGFPLVEGLHLILGIRDLVEQKNILASKREYSQNLTYLPDGDLVLDDSTLGVLVRAFAAEAGKSFEESVLGTIKTTYQARYGSKLNASLISSLRSAYFRVAKVKLSPVYQLPPLQLVGDCDQDMFRKTYMGPVAMTGPEGASIICEKVLISFPANAYLINVFSLPEVRVLNLENSQGVATVTTDVMRSYKNTLVVSKEGEQMISLIVRPKNLRSLLEDSFNMVIEDREGTELVRLKKAYSERGALINLRLRTFSGDHVGTFQYSL